MPLTSAALLLMLPGVAIGWLLATGWQRRHRHTSARAAQLLRWLEQAPLGVLVLDQHQRVRFINSKACRLLRLEKKGDTGAQPLLEVVRCHQLEDATRAARSCGELKRVDWLLTTTSRNPSRLEPVVTEPLEAFAIPDPSGWVGVFLTSRRSLMAQQEQQERWVSDVAHELKTPLTALGLVGESLADCSSPRQAALVGRLRKEVGRLQNLVDDLLELSRLGTTLHRHQTLSPVDVAQQIDNAWQLLLPLAEPRQVRLQVSSNANDPSIPADASRLQRALLNLLDNALRYSPNDSTIHVNVHKGNRWLRLVVTDQGPGFSPEDLAHVFERFYRGDASRVRASNLTGGSGLGLAIVQQIASTHRGYVQARNQQGGGAAVELVLPLRS